jgi:hypothetical protein
VRADRLKHSGNANKEVTMLKRVTIVALVVAAFLLLAVPALAWNGYREDYTTSDACGLCHGGIAGIPPAYQEWAETKHAVAGADDQALRLPYGSVCQGCHTANFDPAKAMPTPTATSTSGSVSWGVGNGIPTEPQAVGEAASSENFVGCSSCHYGANVATFPEVGIDPNDSAHNVPYGNMADAQICGQCHSRYAYTVDTYTVQPVPTPTAAQTTLIQPQMAIGYPMLGYPDTTPAWSPVLADYLTVPQPGWTPMPDPSATAASGLMTYWQIDGHDSMWQNVGHDGSAAQYPEWMSEGHAGALDALKAIGQGNNPQCLECHSTDYRLMQEWSERTGNSVAGYTPKYGLTCVACHAPHDAGTVKGAWDKEFDAQLIDDASLKGNASNLCVECHNGELPEGSTATPGTAIHHPMKEMIDGYGAIDVQSFPSVHKGKCVKCHMAPTSISRGSVQLGGNHTFTIIKPEDAAEASPIPYATATAVATATPTPGGTPVITTTRTVTWDSMPFSACSTCHNNDDSVADRPEAISTTRATPTPDASPLRVNVTVDQLAEGSPVANMAGGDKAMWLQDTIDQRQSWTHAKIDQIYDVLDAAAMDAGYADYNAARNALVAIPSNEWTTAQRAFLSAFTNVEFVESEGSFGIHNWDYSRAIVNTALSQARIAESGIIVRMPWKVTFKASKTSVKAGGKVTYSGTVKTAKGVPGSGKVKIMKRVGGVWKVWKSKTLTASGSYKLTIKMTAKGKFYLRAYMPANSLNLGAYSPYKRVTVK